MNVKLRKIGNSEGVILPKELLNRLNLRAGDELTVVEDDGDIRLLRPHEDVDIEQKMKIARERMKKYEVVYRALAK